MARSKVSNGLLIGLIIAIIFGISLFIRTYFPHEKIFVGDWVKFSSIDVYFYMRLVDNLVQNFPHLTNFDPFLIYPGGGPVNSLSFFHLLLSGVIWIAGLGSPTQHTVDVIGNYFPAVMGALTVVPVFFIGKTLFNKWTGVVAAGLLAVFPGEFISRSMLGAGDTPPAETLFTATALAFLIAAIKTAGQRQLTFKSLVEGGWKTAKRPLVFSLLAGLFLGMYLISWLGALLFIFIIVLYLVVQFTVNHLHRRSSDHLCITAFVTLLVAFIVFTISTPKAYLLIGVAAAVLVPPVLWAISRFMSGRGLKRGYYPLTLVVIIAAAVGIAYAAVPAAFKTLLASISFVFFPLGSTARTTVEMQPFLMPWGDAFTTLNAWGNFTTSFFIAPWWIIPGLLCAAICGHIYYLNTKDGGKPWLLFLVLSLVVMALVISTQLSTAYSPQEELPFIPGMAFIALSIIIYLFVKKHDSKPRWFVSLAWVVAILVVLTALMLLATFREYRYLALLPFIILLYPLFKQDEEQQHLSLFVIWTLLMLIITMIQRRFAYYLVVNLALLSAYLTWQIVWLAGARKTAAPVEPEAEPVDGKAAKREKLPARRGTTIYRVNVALALIAVLAFLIPPNMVKAKGVTSQVIYAPSDAWHSSLLWMKENTPEPMGDAEAYYRLYEEPAKGESFQYPDSAYGVTSWWDYGYWISRTAHRIPSANPSQDPKAIKTVASLFLSNDETSAREVMAALGSSYVILDYPIVSSKFYAVVDWAGQELDEYMDYYYILYGERAVGQMLYYPEYYRNTSVRLFNFNGEAVTGVSAWAITYEEFPSGDGEILKVVTERERFSSYEEALKYVESQENPDYCRIVGGNPFESPVALEAMEDYRLVHSSEQSVTRQDLDITMGDESEIRVINFKIPEVKIFEYTPPE